MSVLIKGMEMPQKIEPGLVIEFANGINGKRYARLYHYRHGGLTEWLEAVPVPKHGRLIEADALTRAQGIRDYKYENGLVYVEVGELVSLIKAAPTIIPAEEE